MEHYKICPSCLSEVASDGDFCPYCGGRLGAENQPHQLPIGTKLNGRYIVGATLGEGGFGITYVGRDTMLDMKVAIKEYYPSGSATRYSSASISISAMGADTHAQFNTGKGKFLDEARALARFSDEPNIVCVRDFFEENNTAYIVMEFLEGVSLAQELKEHGRMSFSRAFSLLEPVMQALGAMHNQGIIHRDISPSNLMLLHNGRVKLLDFGTARTVDVESEQSLSVILKPGFAPEEQYRSHGDQGAWTDVYAMCATIYKLITGVTPENSMDRLYNDTLKAPSALGADITAAEERALMHGLAVRRDNRTPNMRELVHELSGVSAAPEQDDVTLPAGNLSEDEDFTRPADSYSDYTIPQTAPAPSETKTAPKYEPKKKTD